MTRRTLLMAAAQTPRFLKGIGIVSFPAAMPLGEIFATARNTGFDAIEIRLGNQIKHDTSADELARIRELAARHRLTIASCWVSSAFLPAGLLSSPEGSVRQKAAAAIQRGVEIAGALGCSSVLLNVVRVGPGAGYQETWDRFTEGIRASLPTAARHQVILTPENVHNRFLLSPREAREFVDQFRNPWAGFFFDIGNIMPFGDPQDWILTLGSRIKRIHLKDMKLAKRGGGFEFTHLGEGDVDWRAVMGALIKTGYRGSLTHEFGHDAKDPEALRRSSAAIDRIIALA